MTHTSPHATTETQPPHISAPAQLRLLHPESRNDRSAALRSALVEALSALSAADSVRVVVLTGEGKAFGAGLDLRELGSQGVPA